MSWGTLAEFDLACARSRRRAAARRAALARRAVLNRRALHTFVVLVIALVALVNEATRIETAPAPSSTPAKPSSMLRMPALRAGACGIPQEFAGFFRAASMDTGLSLSLLAAVAWEESRMNPNAVSSAGAHGLLQLMPGTAAIVGVAKESPSANILAGARYLRLMLERFQGDLELALAAYNAGPTAIERAGAAPSIATLRYAKNVEVRVANLEDCE
jgi:soluble lytic murein transglycosylase-like protein